MTTAFRCPICHEPVRYVDGSRWTHQTNRGPSSPGEAMRASLKDDVCNFERLRIEMSKAIGITLQSIRTMKEGGQPVGSGLTDTLQTLLMGRRAVGRKLLERKAALTHLEEEMVSGKAGPPAG